MLLHLKEWAHPLEDYPLIRNVGRLAEAFEQMVGEIGIYPPATNQGDGSDTGNSE